ncbi:putative EF-hand domain-containing protein [Helianthus anomalus]
MVCSARLLDVSYPLTSSFCSYVSPAHHNSRYFCTNPKSTVRWRSMSLSDPDVSMDASAASIDADSAAKNAAGYLICFLCVLIVDAMLQKLEKEIDDVDAKIGDRWRVLDRDYDGKVTTEEVASAAIYLKDTLGKEGLLELISNRKGNGKWLNGLKIKSLKS